MRLRTLTSIITALGLAHSLGATTVTLQAGLNGYAGVTDAELRIKDSRYNQEPDKYIFAPSHMTIGEG
jgi:hypothetical protein